MLKEYSEEDFEAFPKIQGDHGSTYIIVGRNKNAALSLCFTGAKIGERRFSGDTPKKAIAKFEFRLRSSFVEDDDTESVVVPMNVAQPADMFAVPWVKKSSSRASTLLTMIEAYENTVDGLKMAYEDMQEGVPVEKLVARLDEVIAASPGAEWACEKEKLADLLKGTALFMMAKTVEKHIELLEGEENTLSKEGGFEVTFSKPPH